MAHIHRVYDTDNHFQIDGLTRLVKNVSQVKAKLVQYDHKSERFTFEVPRFVDGHDLSLCNIVQVHYINTDSKNKESFIPGVYNVDDLQVWPADENIVICSWLISGNATQLVGNLSFLLRFVCIREDGEVVYAWHTEIHKNVFVTDGINNTAEVLDVCPADAIEQLEYRVHKLEEVGITSVAWKNITDKPFGEVYGDTVYFNGDIRGLPKITVSGSSLYLVTGENCAAPSAEEMGKAHFVVKDALLGSSTTYKTVSVNTLDNGDIVCSTSTGFVLAVSRNREGLYVWHGEDNSHVASVTIPGYTGFISRKKMDAKYLPEPNYIADDWIDNLKKEMGISGGGGLTTEQITALDNMFRVCAFTKDDVSAEYNAFRIAFGIGDSGEVEPDVPDEPEKTLTSISATYSGGDVPAGTAVADLTGIVVTAHYSDGSTETVTGYTLSGTIAEGSNTITVSYGGKTSTFTVTGEAEESGLAQYEYTIIGHAVLTENGGTTNSGAYNTTDFIALDADQTQMTVAAWSANPEGGGGLVACYAQWFNGDEFISRTPGGCSLGTVTSVAVDTLDIPAGATKFRICVQNNCGRFALFKGKVSREEVQ